MIHTLLILTRPLIVLDTETTGVNRQAARIVELGFRVWTSEGLRSEWRSLVNPEIAIQEQTTKIHGITNEMMKRCRKCNGLPIEHPVATGPENVDQCFEHKPIPTFRQLAPKLAVGFSGCDFAGKNVRFDLEILANEFKRAGVAWGYAGARIVDGDRLEALLNPRDLSTLYKKYTGRELEGAHGALADVKGVEEVICGQLSQMKCDCPAIDGQHSAFCSRSLPWTPELLVLPKDLDALHALQWPNFVDAEGKFKFDDGTPVVAFGKHSGTPMRDVDSSYWDWILRSDFNAEVKAIAANAKMRKFPEVK